MKVISRFPKIDFAIKSLIINQGVKNTGKKKVK